MKVSILGFGRFGQTLYKLIKDDFSIILYDKNNIDQSKLSQDTKITKDVSEIYQADIVFFAIPISDFENVIIAHKKYFKDHLLIDVLSVKMHPAKIFKKYLEGKTEALLTHPMFGPDSSKDGFDNLPIIIDKFLSSEKNYQFWKDYFKNKGLKVIEMSAKDHDQMAATAQGLTHFIGRLLDEYNFKPTLIDSLGTRLLHEVQEQTCNDSWQLFEDLQHFNPYTKQMRIKLGDIYDQLYNKLLPKQVNPKYMIFGIQGGPGSFNEEAIYFYIKQEKIKKYKIKYLYTAERVLQALHKGDIDRGQFAIQNSVGGVVGESIEAMAKYKFKIVEQFEVKISHAIMIRKDAKASEITTIMTHPQVLAQCKATLSRKYPHLKQTSGEKELIDQSMVAKYLSQKKLPKNIATMGSKILAEIYNLQIVEDNLQDAKENYTSFMQVARI